MISSNWLFALDVGGTFCDLVARNPNGLLHTHKTLSSGRVKGITGHGGAKDAFVDPARMSDPPRFWNQFQIDLFDDSGHILHQDTIAEFDASAGKLSLNAGYSRPIPPNLRYELHGKFEAPILAIRYLLGLRPDQPIPPCDVRLGTTRGTNALLERSGAVTAFVITEGFADLLHIGDQTRPELFNLNIQRPTPLVAACAEIHERIAADGTILTPIHPQQVEATLSDLRDRGVESIAISLLNAWRNPAHEEAVAEIAERFDFRQISVSTQLSPSLGFLNRSENCVVDAYLGPVFRDYLAHIEKDLPGSRLRLMTGAGGLVASHVFSGSQSVMSGPAGGLVGAAHVARRHRVAPVITFDMGGTSADVARYDGNFEYQFETRKAGARLTTPVLAIETVAAGGGSVCRFDGARMLVGPHSAGTDPGPACYGRGGPLTLTDCNLYLNRVPIEHFPFPLDPSATTRRLKEIADSIGASEETALADIAQGFIDIANLTMSSAIRRITTERGIDPSNHTLICFGGAGAQHICAVADSLDITRVIVPALAGALSAEGVAHADVKRFAESPVYAPLDADLLEHLDQQFTALQNDLIRQFEEESITAGKITFARQLDVRYTGEGASLSVTPSHPHAEFESLYQARYGYTRPDGAIEITSARVEAVASATMPAATTSSPSDAEASSAIIGPTTLHHHMSAIVVDTGWTARRLNDGSVQLLAIRSKSTVNDSIPTTTDAAPTPARIELFHQRFAAIADQMGAALQRTAISTNVKERNDFSCALFDDNGRLIANAPHIPVHLGSMGACVRAVIETGHTLNPGDVICVNDPACGGTHLPDITVVTPVFANDALAFLVASRAHHAEIGGLRPGSMTPDATSLAQEGVLIKPFKLVDAGRERLTEMRDLLTNAPHPSRNPDENIADLIAQIAANRAGATALHTLINDFGTERLHRFTHLVRAAAETKMQSAIRNIPDGEYTCADQLDDGASVTVKVTIHDESAKVDFTGSAPVHPGALNATPAIVASAVLYCFRCLIHDHVPLNDGLLAPIEIIIPPGLLNPPAHDDPSQCPAVAGGNVETSQRVVDVVLTALGVAANSQGTMNNVIFGNDRVSFYETLCGGHGAGPNYHGADAVHTHMTNTRLTDPEVLEARYPVRLRQFAIRRGSGGTGQHVGGDGCVREIEFLEPVQLSLITQRRTRPPQGLEGGESGSPGVNRLWVASRHHWESLNPIDARDLQPGDQLRIETPGGGGFGPSASE